MAPVVPGWRCCSCFSQALGSLGTGPVPPGWRCWGCCFQVLARRRMVPMPAGWQCQRCCFQHLGLAHGWSRSFFQAGCTAFVPHDVTVSGVGSGLAQGGWSGCCSRAPECQGTAPMPPAWRSWSCSSWAPEQQGRAPVSSGRQCWGCYQHLGLAHGWSRGDFQAGCTAFAPAVVTVSGVGCGLAQGAWSGCCFQALGSCGMAPVVPG